MYNSHLWTRNLTGNLLNQATLRTGEPQLSQLFPILGQAGHCLGGTPPSCHPFNPYVGSDNADDVAADDNDNDDDDDVGGDGDDDDDVGGDDDDDDDGDDGCDMDMMIRDCGTYTLTIGHSTLEKCHLEHKLKLSQRLSNRQSCPEKENYFEHTHMRQHMF